MAKFGNEMAMLIAKHYPLALTGDDDQFARCAAEMATTFGGLLALAYRRNGKEKTGIVIEHICRRMLVEAGEIEAKAIEMLKREAE